MKYFQNLFKSYSGRLLITTSLFIKFQGSSFHRFWDIMLIRVHLYFWNGNNSGKGHNSAEKKIRVRYFSWGIHIRNFKTVACTCLKLCYASKSVTNGQTNERTNEQTDGRTPLKQYAPPSSSKLGGITCYRFLIFLARTVELQERERKG